MRAQGGGAFGVDSLPSAFDTPSYPEGAGLLPRLGEGEKRARASRWGGEGVSRKSAAGKGSPRITWGKG